MAGVGAVTDINFKKVLILFGLDRKTQQTLIY